MPSPTSPMAAGGAPSAAAPPAPAGSRRLLLVVMFCALGIAVAASSVAVWLFFAPGGRAEAVSRGPAYVLRVGTIVVNVAETNGRRYVRTTVELAKHESANAQPTPPGAAHDVLAEATRQLTQVTTRLREEIAALVTQASQQDEADEAVLGSRRGDALPAELARREDRLTRIEAAMRRLEEQAKAEAAAECQRRAEAEAERRRTGKTRRGKAPKPRDETPADKAQRNVSDPALRSMQTNNKGWEYCGNAQGSVDGAYQIILASDVTDAANDTQQAEPVAQATLATLAQAGMERPKDESGVAQSIPATLDNGSDSEAAVEALED